MTLQELETLLKSTGLPVVYLAWKKGKAPKIPYICFYSPSTDNFAADNKVYFSAKEVTIELYTELKDERTEKLLTDALDNAGIYWDSNTVYVDTEQCYETIYEIEV